MGRTFQFGTSGLETMLTDEGSILNTQSAPEEVTVVEGNVATTVENPNYQPDAEPAAEVTNAPGPELS